MDIEKRHSLKKLLLQLLLLAVPTVIFVSFILWRLNNFYTILENEWLSQGLYFLIGSFTALLFFSFRFRFITTTLVIFGINYFIYVILQNITIGEFDSFFVSVKFYIFSILFSIGWLVGYAFSRSKYLTIAWSAAILISEIVLISKTADITVNSLLNGLIPILVYAFYLIYTAELIRNLNEDEKRLGIFITKRLGSFAIVLLVLFIAILSLFKSNFTAIEKDWGGGSASKDGKGKESSESMTKKDKDGGISNKDQTKLSGSLNKDKNLVFVAKLDNYFEGSDVPNPLYFTSLYYTKFDTATQTFEIDDKIPYNDLFQPDPSKIPLYFKATDPSIIKKSLGTLNRKVVRAEIYNVNLSPDTYLAPSTAFYCQPISVPKEYKDQFKSAYTAKMWVSELNSAYFIYNPAGNRKLEMFQELRFAKLREIQKIEGPDKEFMNYYTYMPKDEEYKKITDLAKRITKNQEAPIDKIIAIRDYFLSKDEFNLPLYAYSDNPGIPGMPSANKLNYFLFENRKGYCAYFAGATLFMLRSLGIPSRVAAGFSITDRSSKNPGWYWFYEDQAHAWVQVYFQGYGWIDFDTTIPDINTQQASQPDGTPPTDIPPTYLVIDGDVFATDTVKKTMDISSAKILYHDSEFVSTQPILTLNDVSLSTFANDTGSITLAKITKGMRVTAISHAEALKEIYIKTGDSLTTIINKLPRPIPIDEIKIITKKDLAKKDKKGNKKTDKAINWLNVLYGTLFTLIGLGIIALFAPLLIWLWLNARANKHYNNHLLQTYHIHRATSYYLNQLGFNYYQYGPDEYARKIDHQFKSNLSKFNTIYQKTKYSKTPLTDNEATFITGFYQPFIKTVKQGVSLNNRIKHFFNISNTIQFFTKPKIEDDGRNNSN